MFRYLASFPPVFHKFPKITKSPDILVNVIKLWPITSAGGCRHAVTAAHLSYRQAIYSYLLYCCNAHSRQHKTDRDMSSAGEKRKATSASASNDPDLQPASKKAAKSSKKDKTSSAAASTTSGAELDYEALTLPVIQSRIKTLCHTIPSVPAEGLDPKDNAAIKAWAAKMQTAIEAFNLHICTVSAATYKWGSDRSGAADQNLALLSSEIANAQDQITSSVNPRLTNVLAPVVDLVIAKSITTTEIDESTGKEQKVKTNVFTREQVDPDFLKLCDEILARNAVMLRTVVLANFLKVEKCIGDYIKACEKDRSHDARGFAY